jgi:hypothetical protein
MNPATDWIDQARGLLDLLTQGAAAGAPADDAAHGSDCRWCPLCQAAAVLRGERPEVTAAIADVLTAAATALRAFAEPPAPADDPEPPAAPAPSDPAPVVQQIDIA